MKQKEKISFVLETLERLYPNPPIPLNHTSSYTLLVAVLLSAQCTDIRVNQVTEPLFKKADTPQEMAKLSYKTIQEIIRPCGLSERKAKAIQKLSAILVEEHNSQVPDDIDTLETFPGVGHKTASVVMSQAFGVPSFPVDTHIHRLAHRWKLSNGKSVVQTERDLKRLFSKKYWNKLHLQIIYYGREYCPALRHNLEQCIICNKLANS